MSNNLGVYIRNMANSCQFIAEYRLLSALQPSTKTTIFVVVAVVVAFFLGSSIAKCMQGAMSEWADCAVQAEHESLKGKRAYTQLVRERSSTVVSAG